MSIARHHAEWLSLVETSGPFLSMPVLLRAFPQGLDSHDADRARDLRLAFDEWEESQAGRHPDPALHTAWLRFVLTRTLEWPAELLAEGQAIAPSLAVTLAEHGETLRPDLVLRNPAGRPDTERPRLLVQTYAAVQDLRRLVTGRRWKASPETRMAELLRGLDVRLGLVTNGEHWLLVSAVSETAGFASWYASLWLDERLTLQAFRSLLGARRFFGVADDDTLVALLDESAGAQQEVTDQLGYQVRRAVEVLVQALDQADKDHGRALLRGVPESRLYEAAVTVMMRLVFLLAAEERKLLLLGDPLFDQHYAVSTLLARLRETTEEEVLERRLDAWCRLLATFRAVHGGMRHDRLTLPAYGGSLFDPDRFPFLEGRADGTSWRTTPASPLPINNRTVLHLLDALQMLQVRVPGGGPAEARRLSFRALDIEQIGHVYEGLLDHTAVRAAAPVVGLAGTRAGEMEVPLDDLEKRRADGEDTLVDFLREATHRSEGAIRRSLTYEPAGEEINRFLIACDNDLSLERRVRPFSGLLREDPRGYPVVIAPGSVYVTAGADRRTTGTHYTPRGLTEPIVQHALDPLVYGGPAEGRPRGEWWLRPARDLLALRVCDMAMGSGAFLVQICRYLSARLVEAWEEAERRHPEAPGITPEGAVSAGGAGERLIPKEGEERLALARRLVADRCLFGVDRNSMAVEMAKLSLWLVTLQKDRPFTFLDHALRCGDSLLGVTDVRQIERFHLDPGAPRQLPLSHDDWVPALEAAIEKRRRLESFPVEEIRDAEEKARLLAEAETGLVPVKLLGDLIIGAALSTAGKKAGAFDATLERIDPEVAAALDRRRPHDAREPHLRTLRELAARLLRGKGTVDRVPFHWALEFPEVFSDSAGGRRGFDAIVGNPPFLGGQKITGILGTDYRNYLVQHLAGGRRGSADLVAYFFLRARQLLRDGGGFGMLATNTIAQGDTREVGLEQLVGDDGCVIARAVPSRKWPGTANLEVAHVWVRRGEWRGERVLDERPVEGITAFLTTPGTVSGKPYRLAANEGKSFQGSNVLSLGFMLPPEEAQELISRSSRNRDVLLPYLNGEDLNSRPDQSPSRWVINFRDWPLRRGAPGRWHGADGKQQTAWLRAGVVPGDYPDPVAADYPDCLGIVEAKVKPERDRLASGDATARDRARRWWQFARPTRKLYATIAGMDRVLAVSLVNNHLGLGVCPPGWVFAHRLAVFPLQHYRDFGLLQSHIHYHWAWQYSSTMRTDINYSPSDCFETFPFPRAESDLNAVGERYDLHRRSVMLERSEGLTKTYNRLHDPVEVAADIVRLRALQAEMDQAVAKAYSWGDVDLGHGFHETKQGVRFTISEAARREVLGRLLRLNHERYAEEVRQGLHDKKRRRAPNDTEGEDEADGLFTGLADP